MCQPQPFSVSLGHLLHEKHKFGIQGSKSTHIHNWETEKPVRLRAEVGLCLTSMDSRQASSHPGCLRLKTCLFFLPKTVSLTQRPKQNKRQSHRCWPGVRQPYSAPLMRASFLSSKSPELPLRTPWLHGDVHPGVKRDHPECYF